MLLLIASLFYFTFYALEDLNKYTSDPKRKKEQKKTCHFKRREIFDAYKLSIGLKPEIEIEISLNRFISLIYIRIITKMNKFIPDQI